MSRILIATTLHAYVTDSVDTSQAWLYNAEQIVESVRGEHHVEFFAALETDARGMEPFLPMIDNARAEGLTFNYWTFQFDDHATHITTENRLRRITTGQNMCSMYADHHGHDWLLFCAADCAPPGDVLPKLLEMDHPIVGPEIPTYCLTGREPARYVSRECEVCDGKGEDRYRIGCSGCNATGEVGAMVPLYPFPVEEHMLSAACIMLRRDVFTKLRWRTDRDAGMTDDPCLHHDARTYLGLPSYCRKDCVAQHYPESIPAIEERGHDRKVYR